MAHSQEQKHSIENPKITEFAENNFKAVIFMLNLECNGKYTFSE